MTCQESVRISVKTKTRTWSRLDVARGRMVESLPLRRRREMARLRVTLIGGVGFRFDSGQTAPLPGRKSQALLAYLALQRGQAQPRDKLAALLWPEAPHERARHNLRQLLLGVRQAIPPTSLKEVGETVALEPAGLDVDVTEFERLAASGTPD